MAERRSVYIKRDAPHGVGATAHRQLQCRVPYTAQLSHATIQYVPCTGQGSFKDGVTTHSTEDRGGGDADESDVDDEEDVVKGREEYVLLSAICSRPSYTTSMVKLVTVLSAGS